MHSNTPEWLPHITEEQLGKTFVLDDITELMHMAQHIQGQGEWEEEEGQLLPAFLRRPPFPPGAEGEGERHGS